MSYLLKCMDQLRKCSVYELKFRKNKLVLLKSYYSSDGESLEKSKRQKKSSSRLSQEEDLFSKEYRS